MVEATQHKPGIEEIASMLRDGTFEQSKRLVRWCLDQKSIGNLEWGYLGRVDRFVLLTVLLRRYDAVNEWLYNRIREVESEPDGCLDLWARFHYKSSIITFAGTIQEIIKDPEITIGIFSHTKTIARKFLSQIKLELEKNETLRACYPDIFWQSPEKEAPIWSLDSGIVVKRKGNPKEKTVEAWGLVDGQPTSAHFALTIYDDVVTEKSVTSPEMILKTTEAWELSRNLSAITIGEDGQDQRRTWYIGTRYSFSDTYGVMLARGIVTPRVHPATNDGTVDGKPVFLSPKIWEEIKTETSAKTLACQQLQNPLAGEQQEFKPAWVRPYEVRPETLNVYILVDPANSKKKASCRTAMAVIGVDHALNKYLLDGLCHKLDLNERWQALKFFRHKWLRSAGVQTVRVGYERYGMQADIQHFETMMRFEKCAFEIEEVNWAYDSEQAKDDRIRRLIPDHQNWRFFYPIGKNTDGQIEYEIQETSLQRQMSEQGKGYLVARPIKRKNEDGRIYNLVEYLVTNEYNFFPATTAKDFLDAMSRIYDMKISAPMKLDRGVELVPAFAGEVG